MPASAAMYESGMSTRFKGELEITEVQSMVASTQKTTSTYALVQSCSHSCLLTFISSTLFSLQHGLEIFALQCLLRQKVERLRKQFTNHLNNRWERGHVWEQSTCCAKTSMSMFDRLDADRWKDPMFASRLKYSRSVILPAAADKEERNHVRIWPPRTIACIIDTHMCCRIFCTAEA